MKVRIDEHDSRLEMIITSEDYQEWILLRAFLRESTRADSIPISKHLAGGGWTLTLGECKCEERAKKHAQRAKREEK